MPLKLLDHCVFSGPALPEPFVQFELEKELTRLNVLPKTTGDEGRKLQLSWDVYRRKLRELDVRGGPLRVRHCILDPLVERLGFVRSEPAPEVETREGHEEGGYLFISADGDTRLRTWTTEFDEDLDAPARRGAAYRFSHLRIAQRVLLAAGERIGLLTNGVQLRVLISDPARPDSEVVIPIESAWKRNREVPDSYCLVLALCQPKGIAAVPDLVEKARLQQARVTKDLRLQAREAVEHFVQEVLDHPANGTVLGRYEDRDKLAKSLWHEGLVLVYRLLFILKLESTDDPARSFSFASSSLWRNTFSPGVALATRVRDVLDRGEETGRFLEDALRNLFRMFSEGLECSELHVMPLGGALFGPEAAPLLDKPELTWGERAVAYLLDRLLWTQPKRGGITRQRVHYGSLDVEDLGRVYEALLELEAGIATERLCRLRRQKLEVVVPAAQGEKYRPTPLAVISEDREDDLAEAEEKIEENEGEEDTASSGKNTRIEWIEEVQPNRFYLRVGLGRKASGSYYTPHSFVRFLVQETLGPLCAVRSPHNDPNPGKILKLKVLDPAMGSGHFLVEACRFLAEKLYEACRLCDERATPKEIQAANALDQTVKAEALAEAQKYRQRIVELPDPNHEILQYLPSRAPEGIESGLSQRRAIALCRRLVAVHCLYGVDKNQLAVELAKLSLWIESHGEGLPLTFLDHRLVLGDSLTGPFFQHLLTYPNSGEPLGGLFAQDLKQKLTDALRMALADVRDLEATVGTSLSETASKVAAKVRLDAALAPFRTIAAGWAGRVMSGKGTGSEYTDIIRAALSGDVVSDPLFESSAVPYELVFPEVFFPEGAWDNRRGFDVVLGNPPWEGIRRTDNQFFGSRDFEALAGATKKEKKAVQQRLLADFQIQAAYKAYVEYFESQDRIYGALFTVHKAKVNGQLAGRGSYDSYMLFAERAAQVLGPQGFAGWVLPSGFHANEGATGVRRLYFEHMGMRCCYSYENRRKLFEIDSRFKYAAVVAAKAGPTTEFPCAFYLHDDEWLFSDRSDRELRYSLPFIRAAGGEYLNLLELRSAKDFDVAEVCFSNGTTFGKACEDLSIKLSQELNMTYDAEEFFTAIEDLLPGGEDPRNPDVAQRILGEGYLILHEGKTFHQYTDNWEDRPRYVVAYSKLAKRPEILRAAMYYRLAFRDIASATNERTLILSLLPYTVFSNKAPSERTPFHRSNASALAFLAAASSFSSDWSLRLKVASTVNLFLLNSALLPSYSSWKVFLAHAALRLTCNHGGYDLLWAEQVGEEWRESRAPHTWPVIDDETERWSLRAAIDAAVASRFGMSRHQYEHVLSTFSHKSYPDAPSLCLDMFDDLANIGTEAFKRKYDPYWDIPLNEALPKPVIAIPGISDSEEIGGAFSLAAPSVAPKRGRKR
jgi:hypothetical protein